MRFYIVLLIFLLTYSCEEENNCQDFTSNSGLIIREPEMGECYSVLKNPTYIIDNSVDYNSFHLEIDTSISNALGCASNPDRPEINFDTLTLLAAKTEGIGCIVSYKRNVEYSEENNQCTYIIDVYQCGECNSQRINMNYVLIKKIPDSTIYSFEINYWEEP